MRKFLVYLLAAAYLLIATTIAATNDASSHNVIWGVRGPRDVLLKREYLTEKAKVLRTVSKDYEFRQSVS